MGWGRGTFLRQGLFSVVPAGLASVSQILPAFAFQGFISITFVLCESVYLCV